jgi:hypothetical protein
MPRPLPGPDPSADQQIILLLLPVPSKHGHNHREDTMPVLWHVHKQLQVSPNFFQAPAPPSHSTLLTCVSTGQSHAPSKSFTAPSKHGCQHLEDAMPVLMHAHFSLSVFLMIQC